MNVPREQSTYLRGHGGFLAALAILTSLVLVSTLFVAKSPPQGNPISITHTLGLYGVRNPQAAAEAQQLLHATVAIGNPKSIDNAQSDDNDFGVIDSRPQKILYRTMCPNGHGSCHRLSAAEISTLTQRIARAVRSDPRDSNVIGYYLLDDYWFDMRAELKAISRVLRDLSPHQPLTCAFGLNLATQDKPEEMGRFRKKLVNYSPAWCNALVIYSYSPSYPKQFHGSVNWNMSSTLHRALYELRRRGWTPTNGKLIGTPQAFNFNPRILDRSNSANKLEYRAVTSTQSLRRQVTEFCRAGAVSIIAYTWNNDSRGRVTTLSNSPALRTGLLQGVKNCRVTWRRKLYAEWVAMSRYR